MCLSVLRRPALLLVFALSLAACGGDDGRDGQDGAAGADGLNSLLQQTALPSGDTNCPTGGLRLDSGVDENSDGALSSWEIDQTSFVCNGGSALPFQELFDQGVDRYLGRFSPMLSEAGDDGVTEYVFGTGSGGPQCLRGGEYRMATREGRGRELMIFLEGGGACTRRFCAATETASNERFRSRRGILDNSDSQNPAADFDVAYFPYCDGSVFSGDRDYDDDGDGVADRFHRGLQNTSAGLDVAAGAFPTPSLILLTGNSAGGYGANYALPLVRKLWRDVPIRMLNDSGVGIATPGYTEAVSAEWNATAFLPASCTTCIGAAGHTTGYHIYQLDQDPGLVTGFMSSARDSVIADTFIGIGGPAFEAALRAEMPKIQAAHPERFRYLIANGNQHTFLQRAFTARVGGTTIRDWVGNMLANDSDWVSVKDG